MKTLRIPTAASLAAAKVFDYRLNHFTDPSNKNLAVELKLALTCKGDFSTIRIQQYNNE